MTTFRGTRSRRVRTIALSLFAATAAFVAPAAAGPLRIEWADLIPAATGQAPTVARGLVEHGQLPPGDGAFPAGNPFPALLGGRPDEAAPPAEAPVAVRTDLDGTDVTLAGYIVPLGFDGLTVKEFLLVPYVGACIHVPPPPLNQIVFVTAADGIEITGLFDAVEVTGRLEARGLSTDIADVGYQISGADVMLLR